MEDIKQLLIKHKKLILIWVILIFIAYGNVVRGEFVTADDIPGIVDNPMTKDLMGSLQAFHFQLIYRAILFQIFGMNSNVLHFGSIIFHIINTVLAFILLSQLFGKKTAAIATTLFALHPVNSETVCWISAQNYLQGAFFTLVTLNFFVLYRKSKQLKYFVYSSITYVIYVAGTRDAWVLVAPLLLVTIDQLFLEPKIKIKNAVYYIPFAVVAVVFFISVISAGMQTRVSELANRYYFDPNAAPPLLNRLPFTISLTENLLLFPNKLNIYPGEFILIQSRYEIMVIATLLLAGLMYYLWTKNNVYPKLVITIFVAVAPVFSPVQIAWLMAERYLYLGSIFFCVILALLLEKIKNQKAFYIVISILLILCMGRIMVRTEEWRTNKNLWLATRRDSPYSYRVYNNLGDVYMKEGNIQLAIENFKRSFEIFPDYADGMYNLGLTYMKINDMPNAKKYMEMAIRAKPTLIDGWETLGYIALQERDYKRAEAFFMKVLELNPNSEIGQKGMNVVNAIKANPNLVPPTAK